MNKKPTRSNPLDLLSQKIAEDEQKAIPPRVQQVVEPVAPATPAEPEVKFTLRLPESLHTELTRMISPDGQYWKKVKSLNALTIMLIQKGMEQKR